MTISMNRLERRLYLAISSRAPGSVIDARAAGSRALKEITWVVAQ